MSINNWAILAYFLLKLLVPELLPNSYKLEAEISLSCIGIGLIAVGLLNLFISEKRLRKISEITTNENIGAYFKLILLLSFTRLDSLGSGGPIVYMTITLSLLLFCLFVILKEIKLTKTLINGVIVGHIVFGYFLYNWSKSTYVRNYGNEIIGSYWEKPDYRTKYLVKMSKSEDFSRAYTLPAQVHVYTIVEESDYPQEDAYGNEYYDSYRHKYIIIEKVFWPNGGFLEFQDCDLEESDYCHDSHGRYWYLKIDKKL
ncbi:MAG: hypothetical protein KF763_12945 [Cyclobacteriaceae bacterium]|nr:hypothetical protein [Cyclobacteriaceae bacterium]